MTKPLLTTKDLVADDTLSAEAALLKAVAALKNIESFALAAEKTAKSFRRNEKHYEKEGDADGAARAAEIARQAEHTGNEIRTAISKGLNKK